ncbi:hypothetical protein PIB30_034157 [Stylosanthes scabra]|uniref:Uncharacterized protein n=1 Tax=Stylosanthes scabra TaxID=79078 RepID=A0ABU6XEB4_9FABA|nr:hypothetical protein [Stylosanthes scabra]
MVIQLNYVDYFSVIWDTTDRNTLSTSGGPQQAAQKVRQFGPPRSEARPAKSARIVVPSRADLEDTDSDDEDYNPQADVDELLEDHLDELIEREDVERRGKETLGKNRSIWKVHIIENGVERPKYITANQRFFYFQDDKDEPKKKAILSQRVEAERVNEGEQPHCIEEEDEQEGWFGGVTGTDGSERLRRTRRLRVESLGQRVEMVEDESESVRRLMSHQCPESIDTDDWQAFLEYRLEEDTPKKCRKNAENRAKQLYTHVGGSKSLAKRTEEEEIRHERLFSRGEKWTMVHKRKDGSYIHDDARAIGEAIVEVESRDESTKELSQNDSLAHAKAAEEKKKRQTMENLLRFLIQRQGDDLPPEIASEMDALGSGTVVS